MEKPEYESLNALGPMCLNDNLEGVMKAGDLCNRYGLDTITAANKAAPSRPLVTPGLRGVSGPRPLCRVRDSSTRRQRLRRLMRAAHRASV